jgi:hypothetical protein
MMALSLSSAHGDADQLGFKLVGLRATSKVCNAQVSYRCGVVDAFAPGAIQMVGS